MAKLNLNKLAQEIAKREGGKKEVGIAQIKEILKITLNILGNHWCDGDESRVIETLKQSSDYME